MVPKKTGKKRGDAAVSRRKFTKADLSFDFGFNVPKSKTGKKRKPAGGGSV